MGGRRAGIFTALGVSSGQAIWTLATAAGIAALLAASEPAFLAVRCRLRLPRLARPAGDRRGSPRPREAGCSLAAELLVRARAAEQPREPEDGRVLPEPVAAVRRLVLAAPRPWDDVLPDDPRLATAYAIVVARAGDFLSRPAIRRAVEESASACSSRSVSASRPSGARLSPAPLPPAIVSRPPAPSFSYGASEGKAPSGNAPARPARRFPLDAPVRDLAGSRRHDRRRRQGRGGHSH